MDKQWKMRAKDFYELLELQGYRCILSGNELEPDTVCIARRVLLSQGGEHCFENSYLVHRDLHAFTKQCSIEQIVEYCHKILGRHSTKIPTSARLPKSAWALQKDRIVSFNKTGTGPQAPRKIDTTWGTAANRCVEEANRARTQTLASLKVQKDTTQVSFPDGTC
jgi:hypothetical protein